MATDVPSAHATIVSSLISPPMFFEGPLDLSMSYSSPIRREHSATNQHVSIPYILRRNFQRAQPSNSLLMIWAIEIYWWLQTFITWWISLLIEWRVITRNIIRRDNRIAKRPNNGPPLSQPIAFKSFLESINDSALAGQYIDSRFFLQYRYISQFMKIEGLSAVATIDSNVICVQHLIVGRLVDTCSLINFCIKSW